MKPRIIICQTVALVMLLVCVSLADGALLTQSTGPIKYCDMPDTGCSSLGNSNECKLFEGCFAVSPTNNCQTKPECSVPHSALKCNLKGLAFEKSAGLLPACIRGNVAECDEQRRYVYNALDLKVECADQEGILACAQGGCTINDNVLKEEASMWTTTREWYVNPLFGMDHSSRSGSQFEPYETIHFALSRSRQVGKVKRTIILAKGVHRLLEPVTLTSIDSGLTIRGETGAILSGAVLLGRLEWGPSEINPSILKARIPVHYAGYIKTLSTLYVNDQPAIRARYPNLAHFLDSAYGPRTSLRNWQKRNTNYPITEAFNMKMQNGLFNFFTTATGGSCTGILDPPSGYFCHTQAQAHGNCPFHVPAGVDLDAKLAAQLHAEQWNMKRVYFHTFHPNLWGLWTFDLNAERTPITTVPTKTLTTRPTQAPTNHPTHRPTTGAPTKTPTKGLPSNSPTPIPTRTPTTGKPTTALPSLAPTLSRPTRSPTTSSPTRSPTTSIPTKSPSTSMPTTSPTTSRPTRSPSRAPSTPQPTTLNPTPPTSQSPTFKPSKSPTLKPTKKPTTMYPSRGPTMSKPTRSPVGPKPTSSPSFYPTKKTKKPTSAKPTRSPVVPTTKSPSLNPTKKTKKPTVQKPTKSPTSFPTKRTKTPTIPKPTSSPVVPTTKSPSLNPTKKTKQPTVPRPTKSPTLFPIKKTKMPTIPKPTKSPTRYPTKRTKKPTSSKPTKSPTQSPTKKTQQPSSSPTKEPLSDPPTLHPSHHPTTSNPTKGPTSSSPSPHPTHLPTTSQPTNLPSRSPSTGPSRSETRGPTTSKPSFGPSQNPSRTPTTTKPSQVPTTSPTKTSQPSNSPSTASPTGLPTTSPIEASDLTASPEATSPTSPPGIIKQGSSDFEDEGRDRLLVGENDNIFSEASSGEGFRLNFGYGGFQEARGDCQKGGREWFVENALALLDSTNEYYLDLDSSDGPFIYYMPNNTDLSLSTTQIELSVSRVLIQAIGTPEDPVKDVRIVNLRMEKTYPTHMDSHEAPSGGDWTVHREGAVLLQGVEQVQVYGNVFRHLGGNGVFVSNYARDVEIQRNQFYALGSSAILLAGDPLFHSPKPYDRATDVNHIERVLIEENIASDFGIVAKQSAAVFLAISRSILVRRNIMFNCPRAAVLFNDGFGGNITVENNIMFNTVRETDDHGPFNSWDRQRWIQNSLVNPSTYPFRIVRNLIIGSHSGYKGIDLDDGVVHYEVSGNVVFDSFQKFKGNDIRVTNNIIVPMAGNGMCLWMTPVNFVPGKMIYEGNTCYMYHSGQAAFYFNANNPRARELCQNKNFIARSNKYYGAGTRNKWKGCGASGLLNWAKWKKTYKQDTNSVVDGNLPTISVQLEAMEALLDWP